MPQGTTFEEGCASERAAFLQELERMKAACDPHALIQKGTILCMKIWLRDRMVADLKKKVSHALR